MSENSFRQRPQRFVIWLWLLEPFLLVATSPLVLFPDRFARRAVFAALGLLIVPFLIRKMRTGRFTVSTPVNAPIAFILFIALPLSLWATPLFWEITWPKLTSLLWSIAVFFGVVNWVKSENETEDPQIAAFRSPIIWLALVYLMLGLIFTGISLIGMRPAEKMPFLSTIAASLPNVSSKWLGMPQGFETNEVAGVLILFAPLAVALFVASLFPVNDHGSIDTTDVSVLPSGRSALSRAVLRLSLLLLVLIFVATLLITQSRSGLAAFIIALAIILVSSGRHGWLLLGISVFIAGAGACFIGPEQLFDIFAYCGKLSGMSSMVLLTGRPEIWNSALHAISDFPLTGMGLGVFQKKAVLMLYPTPHIGPDQPTPDAHNLYLQTALDLGIAGLIAFGVMLIIAFAALIRLFHHTTPGSLWRYWVLGIMGAFIGHLVYSTTDAVALGTKAGVVQWFLLGLIMATENTMQIRSTQSHTAILSKLVDLYTKLGKRPIFLCTASVIAFLFVGLLMRGLQQKFAVNRAAKLTAAALLANPQLLPAADAALTELGAQNCRINWLRGLVAQALGQQARRDSAWSDLIHCTPVFLPLLIHMEPKNRQLAELAVQEHPESAETSFWLAKICAKDTPERAIALYRKGLALDPDNGRRWRELGDLLVKHDLQAALHAYSQSCQNGDPGANGCWLAGQTAERRGDLKMAISFYRLSRWSVALNRAAQLEREIGRPRHDD